MAARSAVPRALFSHPPWPDAARVRKESAKTHLDHGGAGRERTGVEREGGGKVD